MPPRWHLLWLCITFGTHRNFRIRVTQPCIDQQQLLQMAIFLPQYLLAWKSRNLYKKSILKRGLGCAPKKLIFFSSHVLSKDSCLLCLFSNKGLCVARAPFSTANFTFSSLKSRSQLDAWTPVLYKHHDKVHKSCASVEITKSWRKKEY